MKTHPPAFRRKVVRAYERGPGSIYQTAQKYGISPSTLHRWLEDESGRSAKSASDSDDRLTGGQWVLCPRTRVMRYERPAA